MPFSKEERYVAMAEAEFEKDARNAQRDYVDYCWHQLVDLARKRGAYASLDFEDTTVNVVVRRMGGWPHLCAILRPWHYAGRLRDRFRRLYREALHHSPSAEEKSPVPGLHAQNNGHGLRYVVPVRIGKQR